MSSDLRFYLWLFLRRLPLFILVAGLIGGVAVSVALTLPPAYVSKAQLILEDSQIPEGMTGPQVQVPPEQQLELFQTMLLTRTNMLNIAREFDVLDGQDKMTADQIIQGMRARTSIDRQAGQGRATIMSLGFEARSAEIAASVVQRYLALILEQDSATRAERAGKTQDFFQQEVDRLGKELDTQSNKILAFKNANVDALPESLDYRRGQQTTLQDRIAQTEREIATLGEQRQRLIQIFNATGRTNSGTPADLRTPDEKQLDELRQQLESALLVYSKENPAVVLLKRRIAQLEQSIAAAAGAGSGTEAGAEPPDPAKAMLDLQLGEIDSRVESLTAQRNAAQKQLETITDSIARTPAVSIELDGMQRDYDNIQAQYNSAVARLAEASASERVELMSRGQKVTVVEQPSVPTTPTKPNRKKLAVGGVGLGLLAGFGLIALLEMLNRTARRPEDLVAQLGIAPVATIPILRTRRELVVRRMRQTAVLLLVILAIPAALLAVHVYYEPLDLLADRVMSRFGLRG